MKYILCIGDSLVFGARDEYHSSCPAELSRLFWEKDRKLVFCINQGVSGDTSGDLLRRILAVSKSGAEAGLALILIGTNDTFLPQKLDIYRDNLRQIVNLIKQGRESVGLGLLPPVIGPGLPNYPFDAMAQIEKFNEIIISIAKENNCFLADFRGLGSYIIDTAHFGHEGYCKMAEIWYQAIKKDFYASKYLGYNHPSK